MHIGADIQKTSKRFHGAARYRFRQGLHAGSATEPHWRIVHHPPAGRVDLHSAPSLITKVQINAFADAAHANEHLTLRCIKVSPGLDDVQCRLQSFRTRCASCRLVKTACQPPAETLAADRPSLTVAVDVNVCEAGTVRGVEQLG